VVLARSNDPAASAAGERVTAALEAGGIDAMYDDREDAGAGVKFKDAELVGFPTQVTIGKHVAEGKAEVKSRKTGSVDLVALDDVPRRVKEMLDAVPPGRHLGKA
jgi:prolyl-tRNA synthetase